MNADITCGRAGRPQQTSGASADHRAPLGLFAARLAGRQQPGVPGRVPPDHQTSAASTASCARPSFEGVTHYKYASGHWAWTKIFNMYHGVPSVASLLGLIHHSSLRPLRVSRPPPRSFDRRFPPQPVLLGSGRHLLLRLHCRSSQRAAATR